MKDRRDHLRDQAKPSEIGYIPEITKKKSDNEDKDKGLQQDIATAKADLKKLTDKVADMLKDKQDKDKAWGEKKATAEAKLKAYNDGH